jgi:hypothetical protein
MLNNGWSSSESNNKKLFDKDQYKKSVEQVTSQDKKIGCRKLLRVLKAYRILKKQNRKALEFSGKHIQVKELSEAEKRSKRRAVRILKMITIKRFQNYISKLKSTPIGLTKQIQQSDLLLKDKTKAKIVYKKLRKLIRTLEKTFLCKKKGQKGKKGDHNKGQKDHKGQKSGNRHIRDPQKDTIMKKETTHQNPKKTSGYQPPKVLLLERRIDEKISSSSKQKKSSSDNFSGQKKDMASNHKTEKGVSNDGKDHKNYHKKSRNHSCKCSSKKLQRLVVRVILTYGTDAQVKYIKEKLTANNKSAVQAKKTVNETNKIVENITHTPQNKIEQPEENMKKMSRIRG